MVRLRDHDPMAKETPVLPNQKRVTTALTLAQCRESVKSVDGVFATYTVSRLSPFVVWAAARLGLTPNFFTLLSLLLALGGAWLIWTGGYVLAAALFFLSLLCDVVDGQLARSTNKGSLFGAWFDMLSDRVKDFICIFVIGFGDILNDELRGPFLAAGVVTVLSLRHYDVFIRERLGATYDATETKKAKTKPTGWERLWKCLKYSVFFGVSERYAVLILFLLLGKPLWVLWVYLVWGGIILVPKLVWGAWKLRRSRTTSLSGEPEI